MKKNKITDTKLFYNLLYEKGLSHSLAVSELEWYLSEEAKRLGWNVIDTGLLEILTTFSGTWNTHFLQGYYDDTKNK